MQHCIKNKRLSHEIYPIATLKRKTCLLSIKTGEFIKLCNII